MGMFGWSSGTAQVRPLHRLTPLRDDPARAWLSTGERFRIDALGWFLWVVYLVGMYTLRQIVRVLIFLYLTPIFS
ncbi:MAG TPA: hypothetical protein VHO06_13085, partial [Polyangia bacterium]|nr:hypothetical protein [Polyangia bacterium]